MKVFNCITCITLLSIALAGCSSIPESGKATKKSVPQQQDRSTINQLAKSDFDRMADVEMRENTDSLRLLMLKLYKRNPSELKKSTADPAEKMVTWLFEGGAQHQYRLEEVNNLQSTDALFQAFNPDYKGDRVLSLIVGLYTMLLKAHNDKADFYLTDSIDPQRIYNVARNIEIATWKLSNTRKPDGSLYLLTNEMNGNERNLSFEREFGKIIGRTDLFAIALAEKSQRFISRTIQNLATAVFLPI